jgi:P27 family predicted phage terminase small subunit
MGEWNRIVPELERLQLLSKIDRTALAQYCYWFSVWITATKRIKRQGSYREGSVKGTLVISPWVKVAERASVLMHKFMVEFGLTPSARTRISVTPTKGKTLEELLA